VLWRVEYGEFLTPLSTIIIKKGIKYETI